MTPKKLFDYLDGKLPAREREELELRIANDAQLQRELAIARKLHESIPESQEVIGSLDGAGSTQRGAVLGRRVAVAFAVLVFVNVIIGLWFIFQHAKKPAGDNRSETQVRRELEQSLEKAAASAWPTPNIEADEIEIVAPALQDESVAQVIAAAASLGGSGAKALADERGIVVLVDLPRNREAEFRQKLVALGAPSSAAGETSAKASRPNERRFLQVRIVKANQP